MSVLSKDELLIALKGFIGEEATDDQLTFLENVQDTMQDFEARTQVDWKQKYEENDSAWRQRYKDRFFNSGTDEDLDIIEPEPPKPIAMTFEDLFTEE